MRRDAGGGMEYENLKADAPYLGLLHRLSKRIAIVVFVLAPLPFGSVDMPWVLLWVLLLAVSLILADFSKITPAHMSIILMISCVAIALIAVVIAQVWPL